jgi:hypothetical protein
MMLAGAMPERSKNISELRTNRVFCKIGPARAMIQVLQ